MGSHRKKINMLKKRIIISTYDDIKNPYYGGGGAIAIHELAKRLKDLCEVVVLSWNHSGEKYEVIDGVSYERFGISSIYPKIGMLIYQLALPFWVIIKKYDLWLESFGPPFTTSLLPLFTNKPVVGVVHMLAAEDMQRKYKLPFYLIENFGLRKYENIIVTGKHLEVGVRKQSPESKLHVIENGVDKVWTGTCTKKKQLLFLGRIEVDQKGLDIMLAVFDEFRSLHTDSYKLVIAGSGSVTEMKKLRNLIKASMWRKDVNAVGWVTGRKKERLLRESLCMLLPSRFETFSMSALEALAYGLPVICFDIKGLKWLPKKAVVKVELLNTKLMAKAIFRVVNSPRLRELMGRSGRDYATKFTWDNVTKKYIQFINKLI